MNEYLRQAVIVILCAPFAYLILKLIFRKSIMFKFSFYVILYVLYVSYMCILIGKIGGNAIFWITPINFLVGAVVFLFINKILRKPLEEAILKVRELSKGNLDLTIDTTDRKDELGVLKNSLFELNNSLRKIIEEISTGADVLVSASRQTSSSSEQLSQGASEQASSIEEVSSTMEQISANIEQNTENAQLTEVISHEANQSIEVVNEKSISAVEANNEIASKITIINEIAFQTNLLALNAAVEAARAGDHGKGFGVVAIEVRKLAEKSREAADEIISLSQSALQITVETGDVMTGAIPKIEKTSRLIQEITAASIEQNDGANQVNKAIQQLNGITQQNAASSEELASSAEELAAQAEQLKEAISFFKITNHIERR